MQETWANSIMHYAWERKITDMGECLRKGAIKGNTLCLFYSVVRWVMEIITPKYKISLISSIKWMGFKDIIIFFEV